MMSPKIVLETARCRLRIARKEDIPFIYSATRYQGFNDGMLWDAPETEAELVRSYEDGLVAWRDRQSYGFTICRKIDGEPLGRINIRLESDRVWTIGFWLHPKQQGNGYMTESVKAILELGFTTLNAEVIEAYHALWNVKSEKVLKMAGMKFVEHVPQGFVKHGKWVAENKLSVSRSEWSKFSLFDRL